MQFFEALDLECAVCGLTPCDTPDACTAAFLPLSPKDPAVVEGLALLTANILEGRGPKAPPPAELLAFVRDVLVLACSDDGVSLRRALLSELGKPVPS